MYLSFARIAAVVALAACWQLTSCSSGGGSTPNFEVGGTVVGLSENETIVVQLNGGDDLTITSDGSFKFTNMLPAGTQYTVTVVSGPCDYVTVTNGTGTLGGNVENVTITCTRWYSPAGIEDAASPFGSDAEDPRVAIGTNGDMVVVYTQENDRNEDQVFISHFTDGKWTDPKDLTDHISLVGEDCDDEVDAAVADNGDAMVVFAQHDGDDYQIFVSHFKNGTWTHPTTLADNISPDNYHAFDPTVEMYGNGDAIVAWRGHDGSRYQIFKSEYRNGTWTHPTNQSDNISPNSQNAYEPNIALAGNGEAVIVYRQYDGSRYRMMKSEYRSGTWTHAASLTAAFSPAGQHAYYPRVAMATNGETVVTWYQNDGSRNQIFKSEYRSSTWTHPTGLTDNISPDGQNAYGSDVAMAPGGDTIIVWEQYDGNDDAIFKSEYRSGTWTHPTGLGDNITTDGVDCEEPCVSMSSTDAVIVYTRYYGSYNSIYMQDYRSNTWRAEKRLAAPLTDAWSPVVDMNVSGRAVIAWPAWTNSTNRVYRSYYR